MIELTVNGKRVPLSRFPRTILEATFRAALGTLKGGENLTSAELRVEGTEAAALVLSGKPAELDGFARKILGGLAAGVAGSLHLPETPTTIEIRIE